ncbi:hypothetical protein [Caldovatus sediminis]|nr:hypothetical protein [Caldovatus sediminis]
MARLIPCGRDRALLLPLVVVAAVGRMPAGTVAVGPIPGGGAQDRPRRPLALPISRRASGIFSSRRIERATRPTSACAAWRRTRSPTTTPSPPSPASASAALPTPPPRGPDHAGPTPAAGDAAGGQA